MTLRSTVLPLGFGLSAVLCAPAAAPDEAPPVRPAPRVYTNEDLDRVHPFRDQTGVHSVPAESPAEQTTPAPEAPSRGKGEQYWRREASRVRERARTLEGQAAGLRAQIAERAREQGRLLTGRRRASGSTSGSEATLRAKLEALERRLRQTEDDLLDRARRDGALPGWLR
jgi:flagellar biosynthesis/type III secretory pathway protein FliH